jgi:uncharacterized protein YegL
MVNEEFMQPVETMIQWHTPPELAPAMREEINIFLEVFEKMTDEELAHIHNGLYSIIQQLRSPVSKQSKAKSGLVTYEGMKAQLVIAIIEGREQFDKSMLVGDTSVEEIR